MVKMLLSNNSEKVMDFISDFDELTELEKLRLCIHILESKYTTFNKPDIINLLKKELTKIDDSKGIIINFSKYKKLTFIASKYIELNNTNKLKVIIEMLFNIYETDFNDNSINEEINQNLPIYDITYELLKI